VFSKNFFIIVKSLQLLLCLKNDGIYGIDITLYYYNSIISFVCVCVCVCVNIILIQILVKTDILLALI